MRSRFIVGELVGVNPGFSGGIWLRQDPGSNLSRDSGYVNFQGALIIIEIDETQSIRDPSIRVISNCGKTGWTFESRLQKID